jgi:hypothetical protein
VAVVVILAFSLSKDLFRELNAELEGDAREATAKK